MNYKCNILIRLKHLSEICITMVLPVLLLRGLCPWSKQSGLAFAFGPQLHQHQLRPHHYFSRGQRPRRVRYECCRMASNDVVPRAAVSVILRSPTPSYVLVQRGKEPNKGLWSLPGGKLEGGETTLDGAKRELQEECQINMGSLQWFSDGGITVTDSIHHDENGTLLFHYVIAQCFAVAPSELQLVACDDASDAKWQTVSQIRDKVEKGQTTPGVLRVVERAERMFQQGFLVDD
jgi:8-oxo-dGTP diphosphatase